MQRLRLVKVLRIQDRTTLPVITNSQLHSYVSAAFFQYTLI